MHLGSEQSSHNLARVLFPMLYGNVGPRFFFFSSLPVCIVEQIYSEII